VLFHERERLKIPWLIPNGWLAVDLFFVMSGFVVAHAYEYRIPELGFTGFMRLRVIRFYPLYVLGLLVGVIRQLLILGTGSHEFSCMEVVLYSFAALMFLPAAPSGSSDSIAPLNDPSWSLIFEIWVNALYALFFRFMTTPILCAIVSCAGASIVLATIYEVGIGGNHWYDMPMSTARVLYSFPLGVLIYRNREAFRFPQRYGFIAIAATIVFFMLPFSGVYSVLFIVCMSPLIVALASNINIDHVISDYCGVMSYYIYAIHLPVILLGVGVANRVGVSPRIVCICLIVALILTAQAVNKYYDRPLRRRMLSFHLSEGSITDAVRRRIER
jgi:peptidoglycan/LPS O-acetylase OafA/YrhL